MEDTHTPPLKSLGYVKNKQTTALAEVQGLNKRQIWPARKGSRSLVFQPMQATSEEVKGLTCSHTCSEEDGFPRLQLPQGSR